VWLSNTTDKERKLTLGATLSSWNKRDWNYPAIPAVEVTVPAKSVVKTTLGPVLSKLGQESYWWPNIPFREDYSTQLHYLNLSLLEAGNSPPSSASQKYMKSWHAISLRFGFVEHAEGPFYYTVNGVRVTGFSDATAEGQVSFYDAYSSPAWLPPTKPGTGAPESWRRYMRVGININRLHCSPPTEYMMEAADEVGFMLIPEAPIWGNGLSRYSGRYTPQTYHDMGRACRNHPCIARYSLSNEVKPWPGQWPSAIDDMLEVDDVHPLTYELDGLRCGMVTGPKSGRHAWIMDHYSNYWQIVGKDKGIRGMGEQFWATDGMGWFAVGARRMRVNGWCYMSPWSWINYWPNFLEGMNHNLHAWNVNNHADRTDGVDGWGSPLVKFVQKSLSPYLIQDKDTLAENPGAPRGHENGQAQWPYQAPYGVAGKPTEHHVEVFNGGLFGNKLTLVWSANWDKPDGGIAVKGGEMACEIEPGFHEEKVIAFTPPAIDQDQRKLYLVMDSVKDGKVVFHEDGICMNVVRQLADPSAVFLGEDSKTQGDWQGNTEQTGMIWQVTNPNCRSIRSLCGRVVLSVFLTKPQTTRERWPISLIRPPARIALLPIVMVAN